MNIVRFSAVEQFGVPFAGSVEHLLRNRGEVVKLMASYSIEAQPIPQEPVDITPPYFPSASAHYWTTRLTPQGPVQVHFMPPQDMRVWEFPAEGLASVRSTDTRIIEIPTDQLIAACIGRGPKFSTPCLHEVIVDLDSIR